MLGLVERRFPGFRGALEFSELGTPSTIERYLLKNGGAVAGPKACMGQELMNRQTAKTFISGLWACGESTVMGTGTPAVTISGISAADVILRSRGLPEYRNHPTVRHYVHVIPRGRVGNRPKDGTFSETSRCQWCEKAPCSRVCPSQIDVMGIMRRLEADNILGAARRLREAAAPGTCAACHDRPCRQACRRGEIDDALPIDTILSALDRYADEIAQRVRSSEST
jgi:prolycopene isomerase